MRGLKVIIGVLLGVFVLGAFASATAFALPVILNKAKEVAGAVKFTAEGGEASFSILEGKAVVKCEKVTAEGEFRAKAPLGTLHIMFGDKCTTNLGGECSGLGEKAGKLLILVELHLVEDSLKPLGGAALLLFEQFHFSCVIAGITTLVQWRGSGLCLWNPLNLIGQLIHLRSGVKKVGDPEEVTYWGDKGEEVTIPEGLLASEDDKTFKMAAQSGEVLVKPSEEIELVA